MRALLFTILFLSIVCIARSQSWSTFYDEDRIFQVDIPGEVQLKDKRILTGIDTINVYSYIIDRSQTDEDNFLYLINIADYPEGSFPDDSLNLINDFLSESIESLALNLRGDLEYSTKYKNNPISYKARINQEDKDVIVKLIVMISKDRFFTLQVFTHKDYSLNKEIDRFLESFVLLH